jgi:hypothetical protein
METINFFDDDQSQIATVVVRNARQTVGLCISLEHDGDVEVFLPISAAELIIDALKRAVKAITDDGG